jgi:hypothetical protein
VACLAKLIAVHAQHGREEGVVTEVPGEAQRPAGPAGGGGHLLLRQQVPERNSEGHTGLHQESHGLGFGVPAGNARLQPGDQRPQFADRLRGMPSVAGYVGQPDDGGTEREHRGEVGVVRPGNAEYVRRNGERAGDVP